VGSTRSGRNVPETGGERSGLRDSGLRDEVTWGGH
jgi:hypothetical protein